MDKKKKLESAVNPYGTGGFKVSIPAIVRDDLGIEKGSKIKWTKKGKKYIVEVKE